MLRIARRGEYHIAANYFGTSSQTLLSPVTLHLTFITHFGKSNEKRKEVTIRLNDRKEMVEVGTFMFK